MVPPKHNKTNLVTITDDVVATATATAVESSHVILLG